VCPKLLVSVLQRTHVQAAVPVMFPLAGTRQARHAPTLPSQSDSQRNVLDVVNARLSHRPRTRRGPQHCAPTKPVTCALNASPRTCVPSPTVCASSFSGIGLRSSCWKKLATSTGLYAMSWPCAAAPPSAAVPAAPSSAVPSCRRFLRRASDAARYACTTVRCTQCTSRRSQQRVSCCTSFDAIDPCQRRWDLNSSWRGT
jgi:hypothetical protein